MTDVLIYKEEEKDRLKPIFDNIVNGPSIYSRNLDIKPGQIYCLTGDLEQEIWNFVKSSKRTVLGYFSEWNDGSSLEQAQELVKMIQNQKHKQNLVSLDIAIGYINVNRSPQFDNRKGYKTGPLNVEGVPTFLIFENYPVPNPQYENEKITKTSEKKKITPSDFLPQEQLFQQIMESYHI
jgi:hypothetical protein